MGAPAIECNPNAMKSRKRCPFQAGNQSHIALSSNVANISQCSGCISSKRLDQATVFADDRRAKKRARQGPLFLNGISGATYASSPIASARELDSDRANSRTRSACSARTCTSTRTIPALRCLSRCLLLRSAASAEGSRGEGEATDGAHEPRFFSDVFRVTVSLDDITEFA